MRDLLIPDKYTYAVAVEMFLRFNSGASDNRPIIFSTQKKRARSQPSRLGRGVGPVGGGGPTEYYLSFLCCRKR